MKTNFEPCHMMATIAKHKPGDLSRETPDLCYITKLDGDYYVGSWITGFGFFNVRFPKKTTRKLTKVEIKKYNRTFVQLADHPPQKLTVG